MSSSAFFRLPAQFPAHLPLVAAAILSVLVIAASNVSAQSPAMPEAVAVERLQDGLIDIMNNPPAGGADARSAALGELVADTFDIDAMGQVAVGVRTYVGWSKFQRREFLSAFARFMVATHAVRFEDAKGQDFAVDKSEDAQSGRKLVHARYLRAGEPPVAIDYLVQPANGEWRILDVYLDGTVSLLALHRSEFSSVLRDRGFDGFIAAMHSKADELAARPTTN